MSLLGKIFVVVVTVLSLVFLGMQATLYYHSQDWRDAFERLAGRHQQVTEAKNKEIEKLKGSVQDAEKARDNAVTERDSYKSNATVANDKSTNLQKELSEAKGKLDDKEAMNKDLVAAKTATEKELVDTRTRVDQLSADLKTALGDKETAEAQVARLISQKASIEKDLSDVRRDYTEAKQRVLDQQLVMEELERQGVPVGTLVENHRPVPPISGKVAGSKADLAPGIVLITVGKDDKVEKGYQFTVYRAEAGKAEFVGKVVVEKVYADSAGCRVLFTAGGKSIKPGDDVATRLD